jgi:PAS domain S-box-containing protein
MLYLAIALGIIVLILAVIAILSATSRKKMKSEFDGFSKQINNYESIIDQANDAMLVIDIVNGRVHQSNPSAAQLLGYSKEELEKKSLFDLHPKEMLEKSSSVVADVWEKGGLIYKDIPFVTKSGKILPVECSAKVAPFAGRPAIVIYARDITERLAMEKAIQEQQHIIEEKNKDITDSINYAKRIQTAILPTEEEMTKVAKDYFVFYRPKDIVSGDLYWAATVKTTPVEGKEQQLSIIAALDCTGHGVPGAFMSIVGHTILEQTITDPNVNSPAAALDYLNNGVIKTLKQKADDDFSIKDGMDIAMVAIDQEAMSLQFAGANNPLYIVRNNELLEIDGTKQPIGAYLKESKLFKNNQVDLQKGDCVYIFTDGIPDQFGGPKGKKFKYKQLQEILKENSSKKMPEQKIAIEKAIDDWMNYKSTGGGTYEQTDDILIIGIRVQ